MGDRSADIRFTTDRYRLADLQVAEGRAVIVHALPDNYANVPTRYVRQPDATTLATGDAGDRMACGVVGGGSSATTVPATGDATTTSSTVAGATTTTRAGSTTTAGRPAPSTARPSPSRPTARTRPAASRPPG